MTIFQQFYRPISTCCPILRQLIHDTKYSDTGLKEKLLLASNLCLTFLLGGWQSSYVYNIVKNVPLNS